MTAGVPDEVVGLAVELRGSLSLLIRRLRQVEVDDDLAIPQRAALARLERVGDLTSADLARLEQISPQSMGATLAELEARGLVARRKHPDDGRRGPHGLRFHPRDEPRGGEHGYLTAAERHGRVGAGHLMTHAVPVGPLREFEWKAVRSD